MNLLSWIFFGVVVAILSTMLSKNEGTTGVLSNLLLGILGSILGGILATIILGNQTGPYNIIPAVLALLSALFLLSISKSAKQGS